MSKERETEKRDLPPTPPIESKGKEKERSPQHALTRARELPPVINIHEPPSHELLLAFARARRYTDLAFIDEWYDLMSNEYFWCHPTTGMPLKHWPAYFRACYLNRQKKHAVAPTRHADNWRGTRKEDIGDVLG